MTITSTIRHKTSADSEEMIFSFLRNHPQGTLTTISKNNLLQSSVINIYDIGNNHAAFMTKRGTRKYKNLQNNPTISFMTYDDFGKTEVEIEGIAQIVTDPVQQKEIEDIIKLDTTHGRKHLSPYVKEEDDHVLYVIYPRKIHMTVYWKEEAGLSVFNEAIEFDVAMKS